MGLYVEMMCDVRDETDLYEGAIHHRCESNNNDNPQGRSIREAKSDARKAGWTVIGSWCCCPGCRDTTAGKAAIAERRSPQP